MSLRASLPLVSKICLLSDHQTVRCLPLLALKTFNCTICTFVLSCIYVSVELFVLLICLIQIYVCLNICVTLALVFVLKVSQGPRKNNLRADTIE